MKTGIAIGSLGFTSTGDELVRFLDGKKGKVGYGLRVKSGEIESVSAAMADLLMENVVIRRRKKLMDIVFQNNNIAVHGK